MTDGPVTLLGFDYGEKHIGVAVGQTLTASASPLACPDNATVASTLAGLNVPPESCHLVVLNGLFVAPEQRTTTKLSDGDTLAVWPPVAGG